MMGSTVVYATIERRHEVRKQKTTPPTSSMLFCRIDESEVEILTRLRHNHIVSLLDVHTVAMRTTCGLQTHISPFR